MIYAQHNADPKQLVKFGPVDKLHVSTFAFWLITDAPNSPRFVFERRDYEQCTSSVGSFDILLVPSRLIAVPSAGRDDYQFLHASFQEHLAAQHLADTPLQIPTGEELVLKQEWKEIIRFLAESVRPGTEAWKILWREARMATSILDKFGLIASRIAMWVAAAGEQDGGKGLIGIDLRNVLWRVIERHAAQVPKPLIEAFLELDATDFARRILDQRIRTGRNSRLVSWLELVSIFDLEKLFTDHEKYKKVLSLPEVSAFCPELPESIRSSQATVVSRESRSHQEFEDALRSRNLELATKTFWAAVGSGFSENASEMIQMFDRFPPEAVEDTLLEIATSSKVDEIIQGYAVRQLINSGTVKAHSRLMVFLADLSVDDPLAFAILGNLGEANLNHNEVRIVEDFLRSSKSVETRMAAAELMSSTRSRSAASLLLSSFCAETHKEVRATILQVLADIADESVIETLWALKDTGLLKRRAEGGLWLRAFLVTLQRRISRVDSAGDFAGTKQVKQQIHEWQRSVQGLLRKRTGDIREHILAAALEFPKVLEPHAIDKIIQSIEDCALSEDVRIMAIKGLAQLGGQRSIEYLKKIIIQGAENHPERVLRAASDTLGQLSPTAITGLPGKQPEETRARLAFRRDILFRNGRLLNVNPTPIDLCINNAIV